MSFFQEPITTIAILNLVIGTLVCTVLGPYMVWKRIGLLSDAVAHASLLVLAVSMAYEITSLPLMLLFSAMIGWILSLANEKRFPELDSVLAVMFAGFMGAGLIVMSLTGRGSEKLLGVLFGDVLRTNETETISLTLLLFFILAFIVTQRKKLQLMILHPELAKVEGVNTIGLNRWLLVICAMSVAAVLKLFGVILVTSLFVGPALIATHISNSAKTHAISTVISGLVISILGLILSQTMSWPPSATIAVVALVLFFLSLFKKQN